ncbi:class I SAM-dependent methyltransferase [Bacillus litorisediminis]|uniref:class I SAM-dependent methyltransferase n=1 Tax=Bacillus litorisediminis TaxID=2922713 RepID=UPI001FB02C65|nr:class I SAM-dependent methyltransferase [Bacillus litorisediminis]
MLNKQGFDLWAGDYDRTVQLSEESDSYPFAGYKHILNLIFNEVMQKKESNVLDIGFGTGILTAKLYENGHKIVGIDFSSKMIEIAKQKMPKATLIECDFTKGIHNSIRNNNYDFIISTYALHHLTDQEKVQFIQELLPLLCERGKILIGDIAFRTRGQLMECREMYFSQWDDDEDYFVFDELDELLNPTCKLEFQSISHCGGIIVISKK